MNEHPISLEEHFSFIQESDYASGQLLVAVSGGSDSMALLFLANAWAQKVHCEIHAVTVDHGLRAEAASEALYVASICENLGVPHTTLAWDGIKPNSGISAAARQARYQLINEFALDIDVGLVLTGHNQDDQAETVLMRLRRGANSTIAGRGHAGMCKRVLLGGLDVFHAGNSVALNQDGPMILRPLLNLSRAQLRQYLNQISQSWIEDPSNFDHAYERVRVRAQLVGQPKFKQKILGYAEQMGRSRAVIARDAAQFLQHHCTILAGRLFKISLQDLSRLAEPVRDLVLKTLIAVAGGSPYFVSDTQLGEILKTLTQTENSDGFGKNSRQTLGNCIVERSADGIYICREIRNLKPALITRGESKFWDGRLHVTNNSSETVRIEALPNEQFDEMVESKSKSHQKLSKIEKTALNSSPFLSTQSGAVSAIFSNDDILPEGITVRWGAKAIELFCPEWDFPLLAWIDGLNLRFDKAGSANFSNIPTFGKNRNNIKGDDINGGAQVPPLSPNG